jgi:hypothetical protein
MASKRTPKKTTKKKRTSKAPAKKAAKKRTSKAPAKKAAKKRATQRPAKSSRPTKPAKPRAKRAAAAAAAAASVSATERVASYLEEGVPHDHAELVSGLFQVVRGAAKDLKTLITQAIAMSNQKNDPFGG